MIIALASQKGGTGKTTTATVMLAALRSSLGIDLDAQGNFSMAVKARIKGLNIHDVLMGKGTAVDTVQHLSDGDFISSTPALANVEKLPSRALSKTLEPLTAKYQHIILDTPPVLSDMTIAALTAADVVIIPIQGDIFSIKSVEQLGDIINAIRAKRNPTLKIGGLLLTRFNPRSIARRSMQRAAERAAEKIGTTVFKSTIREAVAVVEAQIMGKSLFKYAPKASVTADYKAFITELEEVLSNAKG